MITDFDKNNRDRDELEAMEIESCSWDEEIARERQAAVSEAKELVTKNLTSLKREEIAAINKQIACLFKKYNLTWTELGFKGMTGNR